MRASGPTPNAMPRSSVEPRDGQEALAAAPVGKKVPATVTAGTEVWGSLAPQRAVRLQLPQTSPGAH
jgi:hypothetical protein